MKTKALIFISILLFFAGTVLYAQTSIPDEIDEAIREIENLIENMRSVPETDRIPETSGNTQPRWVNDPYSIYSRDQYIAAVGFDDDRAEAEKKAIASLVSVFGRSVRSDISAAELYSQAVTQGHINISENKNLQEAIVSAASLDSLIGAQIGNVWVNDRGRVYALAFIEKEKAAAIYTEIARMNQLNINNITAMSDAEKHTFDGYARYKIASNIAAVNAQYANIITALGGSTASLNLSTAASLNLETSNILRNIAINLNVEGDSSNRIQGIFARIINREGLRIQENNAPYTLSVVLTLTEADVPNNRNSFCDFVITANLIENLSGAVLLSFTNTGRESHLSYDRAAARALTAAERAINAQYPALFKDYLAKVWPRE